VYNYNQHLERQERTVKEEVVSRVVGVFEGMKNIELYDRKGVKIMEKHTLNSHIKPRDLAEEELINEANLLGIDLEKDSEVSIWEMLKETIASWFKKEPVVRPLTREELEELIPEEDHTVTGAPLRPSEIMWNSVFRQQKNSRFS